MLAGRVTVRLTNDSAVDHNVTIAQGPKTLAATKTIAESTDAVALRLGPASTSSSARCPVTGSPACRARSPSNARRAGEHLAELVEHALLALADALGVEAEEAAFLGRVGRARRAAFRSQARYAVGLLGRRLLGSRCALTARELLEDLLPAPARPWA